MELLNKEWGAWGESAIPPTKIPHLSDRFLPSHLGYFRLTMTALETYTGLMNPDSKTAIVHAYAKVNLTLYVLGKRPDGFHSIESVIQTISLHDTLSLSIGGEPGIRVTCDMPGIPTGEANLAYKAASLFFEAFGISDGLDIQIEKQIPPEAGLGGGSSDAAAVLRGLSYMLKRDGELLNLAAQTGSDVPFFLVGGTALIRGRGEEVQPLPDIPTRWLVIVKPPFGISTSWAYSRLDEVVCRPSSVVRETQNISECLQSSVCSMQSLLHNDLERPAMERHPEISKIKEILLQTGAQGALMCGSGSAVFGLFESKDEAHTAANRLAGQNIGDLFVTKTITRDEALGKA